MEIKESREKTALIATPVGRIDSTTAAGLEGRLLAMVTQGERHLIVDFSEVDYVSSAGLRVMLALVKRMRDARGALMLCGMGEPVRQVFDLAGFLPLFTVEASRDAALARLPS